VTPPYRRFSLTALALVSIPISLPGQTSPAARNEVIWHWFGGCAGRDSLFLEVRLDGKPIYSATFPICQVRRKAITHEPQQRLLAFRFDGVPRHFGSRYRQTEVQPIQVNIWESGGDPQGIQLGISFSTEQDVLLNMHLTAPANAPSRSERVRGLVITTRPVPKGDRSPARRVKPPG
jgi:hypothetical protein